MLGEDGAGTRQAVSFALDARDLVEPIAAERPVRLPDGSQLTMRWGVSLGDVTRAALTGGGSTVLSDPANVASGWPPRPAVTAPADSRHCRGGQLAAESLSDAPAAPLAVKGRQTRSACWRSGASGRRFEPSTAGMPRHMPALSSAWCWARKGCSSSAGGRPDRQTAGGGVRPRPS